MAADEKWYFTKEQLANTPSRKCGIDADKELSYRQQAANFIQDMGQRLVVTQLCINTAIVYMHRFYVFHSLSQFHRNSIASAALFLAAKVEEQPRKLEHVIKVAHMCLHRDNSPLDVRSEAYQSEAHDLVFNENVLLQTLGFDVAIDHPHTHVVRCCHLVKASKDLAQTSYFMASNSLHLTTMCLQYKPTVVACFCIHLACKWSNWEIPQSNEGKSWFWYVDRSVTSELLAQLTAEFLHIFDKCPSRLKKKIMSISERQSPSMHHPSLPNSPFDAEPRKVQAVDDGGPSFQSARPYPTDEEKKKPSSSSTAAASASAAAHSTSSSSSSASSSSNIQRPPTDYREYRDKKERERLEREKLASNSGSTLSQDSKQQHHHSHHHKQPSLSTPLSNITTSSSSLSTTSLSGATSGTSMSAKHLALANPKTNIHHNHHHHHHNRPDFKLQSSSQRHSNSSSATRDLSRDGSRQRIPRDYPQAPNYSHHQQLTATSGHTTSKDLNSTANDSTNDMMLPPTPEINQHSIDKINNSNNNHSNTNRQVQHDKRAYDPRHKIIDHRKDEQKNSQYPNPPPPPSSSSTSSSLPPPKYPEHMRSNDRLSRKLPDSLEQRSEEVRKLIEKPLPIPKPRAEIQKEEYIASMLKQSHHPNKYSQDNKLVHNNSNRSMYPHDLSKQIVNKSSSQMQQQQQQQQQMLQQQQLLQQQQQHSHMAQIYNKDKNGTAAAAITTAATTTSSGAASTTTSTTNQLNLNLPLAGDDKRKHDELNSQVPLIKHKSLFSPDKITPPQDIPALNQRNKFSTKQKTPPVSNKFIKHELNQDVLPDLNTHSLFSMSPDLPNQHLNTKRNDSEQRHHHHHHHHQQQQQEIGKKIKSEDNINLDNKSLRLPDLLSSTQSSTATTNLMSDHLKLPELLKPFDADLHSCIFNNGLEMDIKPSIKIENDLSPMKSAQGISALLQEPLAPMPSLLQSIGNSDLGIYSQSSNDLNQSQELVTTIVTTGSTTTTTTSSSELNKSLAATNFPELHNDESFVSTVDISAFSAAPIIVSEVPITNATQIPSTAAATTTVTTDSSSGTGLLTNKKVDNHHKSEKKKKKEKHKHKDKDKEKSKDKHKHKHKDKDKHRDKDGKERKDAANNDKRDSNKHEDNNVMTAPIKITIPKDKLNLMDTTTISNDNKKKSPQNARLKIKIPKERLKNPEASSSSSLSSSSTITPVSRDVQAPLKIKIRTNATSSANQDCYNIDNNRKREREGESASQPPSKKFQYSSSVNPANQLVGQVNQQQQLHHQLQQQQQQHQQQQQQQQQQRAPNERQNGRHYNTSSNNKVRGGGRGILPRQLNTRIPPSSLLQPNLQRDNFFYSKQSIEHDNFDKNFKLNNFKMQNSSRSSSNNNNSSSNNSNNQQQQKQQPHQQQQLQQDNPYFFTTYPPPPIFNNQQYYCDPNLYYQYSQPFNLYPQQPNISNVIVTESGTIDTSVPPPNLANTGVNNNFNNAGNSSNIFPMQNQTTQQKFGNVELGNLTALPPLPNEPPPGSFPPPPPPPDISPPPPPPPLSE